MTERVLISIVTYNTQVNLLEICLANLKSNKSIDVSIWDNSASNDIRLFSKEKNYNYIGSSNIGFGKAHNQNIKNNCKIKKYNYVLILNPDVFITNNILNNLVSSIKKNKRCFLLSPLLLNKDKSIQNSIRLFPKPFDFLLRFFNLGVSNHSNKIKSLTAVPFVHGACFLLNLLHFDFLKGFDEKFFLYCEDLDLCRKVVENDGLVLVDPRIRVVHLFNQESRRSMKLFIIHLSSITKYFTKWGVFRGKKAFLANKNFLDYIK